MGKHFGVAEVGIRVGVRYFIFGSCLGCQGTLYVSDKDVNKIIRTLKYAKDFWKI